MLKKLSDKNILIENIEHYHPVLTNPSHKNILIENIKHFRPLLENPNYRKILIKNVLHYQSLLHSSNDTKILVDNIQYFRSLLSCPDSLDLSLENISFAKNNKKSIMESGNLIFKASKSRYFTRCFSQEGEDLILSKIIDSAKCDGTFVDIGSHHPTKLNNTFYFYRRGWTGLNIDASSETKTLFDQIRPRDKNIKAAVGVPNSKLTYYMFSEPAFNTTNDEIASSIIRNNLSSKIAEEQIECNSINDILENELGNNFEIDLLNIDIEGSELDVLTDLNYELFSPKIIICELNRKELYKANNLKIHNLLESKGYKVFSSPFTTLLFTKK